MQRCIENMASQYSKYIVSNLKCSGTLKIWRLRIQITLFLTSNFAIVFLKYLFLLPTSIFKLYMHFYYQNENNQIKKVLKLIEIQIQMLQHIFVSWHCFFFFSKSEDGLQRLISRFKYVLKEFIVVILGQKPKARKFCGKFPNL